MEIHFNVFETKEVDLNPQEVKKRRQVEDYDYADPFIEHFEGEDEAVEIEPHITNFFIYKGTLPEKPSKVLQSHKDLLKKQSRRESTSKPLDNVYCMQNLVYKRITSGEYTEADILDLLLYDVVINHDKNFKLLGEKLEKSPVIASLSLEFINKSIKNLSSLAEELLRRLESLLKDDASYQEMNVVFRDELCENIFYYLDVKTKLEAYSSEITSNKKVNYNALRKSVYNEIYGMLKENTKNKRQIGYYTYQHCKKCKIGKFNGLKAEYLCLEENTDSRFMKTFDTFDSFEDLKSASAENNAKDVRNRKGSTGSTGSTREKVKCDPTKQKIIQRSKVPDKEPDTEAQENAKSSVKCEDEAQNVSEGNSFSLQKVDSQWLDTFSEHPGDDFDNKKY